MSYPIRHYRAVMKASLEVPEDAEPERIEEWARQMLTGGGGCCTPFYREGDNLEVLELEALPLSGWKTAVTDDIAAARTLAASGRLGPDDAVLVARLANWLDDGQREISALCALLDRPS